MGRRSNDGVLSPSRDMHGKADVSLCDGMLSGKRIRGQNESMTRPDSETGDASRHFRYQTPLRWMSTAIAAEKTIEIALRGIRRKGKARVGDREDRTGGEGSEKMGGTMIRR